MVGNEESAGQRWIGRHARLGHYSASGLGKRVAAGPFHPRPFWSPGTGLAVDELGVDFQKIVEAQAEPIQNARPIVSQENVVALRHPLDDLDALRLLQIYRDTALTPVHRDEVVRDFRILH